VRIQLENGAAIWRSGPCVSLEKKYPPEKEAENARGLAGEESRCHAFRHHLPAHPTCFVELLTPDLIHAANGPNLSSTAVKTRLNSSSKFELVSEVLAEAWAKSLADWHRQNRSPIRFDHPERLEPKHADLIAPITNLAANAP